MSGYNEPPRVPGAFPRQFHGATDTAYTGPAYGTVQQNPWGGMGTAGQYGPEAHGGLIPYNVVGRTPSHQYAQTNIIVSMISGCGGLLTTKVLPLQWNANGKDIYWNTKIVHDAIAKPMPDHTVPELVHSSLHSKSAVMKPVGIGFQTENTFSQQPAGRVEEAQKLYQCAMAINRAFERKIVEELRNTPFAGEKEQAYHGKQRYGPERRARVRASWRAGTQFRNVMAGDNGEAVVLSTIRANARRNGANLNYLLMPSEVASIITTKPAKLVYKIAGPHMKTAEERSLDVLQYNGVTIVSVDAYCEDNKAGREINDLHRTSVYGEFMVLQDSDAEEYQIWDEQNGSWVPIKMEDVIAASGLRNRKNLTNYAKWFKNAVLGGKELGDRPPAEYAVIARAFDLCPVEEAPESETAAASSSGRPPLFPTDPYEALHKEFTFVLFRLFMTYTTMSLVGTHGGSETGNTYFGLAEQVSQASITSDRLFKARVHVAAVVRDPSRVWRALDVAFAERIGGCGAQFFQYKKKNLRPGDAEARKQIKHDMVGTDNNLFVVPMTKEDARALRDLADITGLNPYVDAVNNINGRSDKPQFSTSVWASWFYAIREHSNIKDAANAKASDYSCAAMNDLPMNTIAERAPVRYMSKGKFYTRNGISVSSDTDLYKTRGGNYNRIVRFSL